jgi:hypothetical protein
MKNDKNSSEIDMKQPFPSFVVEFLITKHVKKPIIDQSGLDMVFSTDFFKTCSNEIKIFSKFLNEEYDNDDLSYFLFVRSCIEREMKVVFLEKAKEEIKLYRNANKEDIEKELYLNIKNCMQSMIDYKKLFSR